MYEEFEKLGIIFENLCEFIGESSKNGRIMNSF
jgi:hypothetical protein